MYVAGSKKSAPPTDLARRDLTGNRTKRIFDNRVELRAARVGFKLQQ